MFSGSHSDRDPMLPYEGAFIPVPVEEWAIARMLDGGCWVCGTKDCSEHITTPEQYDEKFSV